MMDIGINSIIMDSQQKADERYHEAYDKFNGIKDDYHVVICRIQFSTS